MERNEWMGQALGLFRKKYTALEEIRELTRQMEEALSRNDPVSFRLILKMRAKEMAGVDRIQEELGLMGEQSSRAGALLMRVTGEKFLTDEREDPKEEEIRRIRLRTKALIQRLREEDKRLNLRMAGKKSW